MTGKVLKYKRKKAKRAMEYNEIKLRELILYIAIKSENDESFGAVKLNKLLFYADFFAFITYGKSITGAVYKKLEYGPVPKKLPLVRNKLESAHAAFERKIVLGTGVEQRRLLALRVPDLTHFEPQEIALVDQVLGWARDFSATQISALSHRLSCWQIPEIGEDIPYHSVCIPQEKIPLSPAELEHGKAIAKKLSAAI